MLDISELEIKKDIIVIASGESVLNYPKNYFNQFLDTHFIITLNYGWELIKSHANICLDYRVTDWLKMKQIPDELILIASDTAFRPNEKNNTFKNRINYTFKKKSFNGNFTLVILLELIQKYFNNLKTDIYGLDLYGDGKFYDKENEYDKRIRTCNYKTNFDSERLLKNCGLQLNQFIKNKKIFINRNPQSNYKGFTMM